MTEDASLTGKVAVVTGASSGIGRAAALRLAREGMAVAVAARRRELLDTLVEEIEASGGEALAVPTDVRDWASVQALAEAVDERWGGADLVFANAGTGGGDRVLDMDVAAWRRVLATNLDGVFYTCKALLPLLVDRPGWKTLAVTASVSGTMGMAGGSAYCASKWGVRGFCQSLALEAAEDQVRVTTINPGYVATEWDHDDPRGARMIQPEDIGDLLVYLATLPDTALIDDVTVWPARMYTE